MQDSGSLAVFKVTARDQGHYKGPSGAFVTYCNISCFLFFSSPEPKNPGELIGWEGSVVRRPSVRPSVRRPSTISNDFSSETTGPIATKFHIQPPGPLGKKSCSNGMGHMTNMAAMPIYGKNLKKSSSPEPLDR